MGKISSSGGGGGSGDSTSQGTYANRPAAASGNSGDLYYATDIDVTFRSTGSAWTVVADSWGFKFFEDEGFLDSTMALEIGGLTTIPTVTETIVNTGASWAITDAVGLVTYGADTGNNTQIAWDFPSTRSKILAVAGFHMSGTSGDVALSLATAQLSGTRYANGYHVIATNTLRIQKRVTNSNTDLVVVSGMTTHRTDNDDPFMMAIYYSDSDNNVRFFMRRGTHQWFQVGSATSQTDHTTMRTLVGYVWPNTSQYGRITCPVLAFAAA